MNQLSSIFRANEGLIVAAALCLGIPCVLALVGLIMKSSGVSLRPIVFMFVLVAPLLASFMLVALIRARRPAIQVETTSGLPLRDGHFANRENLFGSDIASEQIRDAKPVFPEFLHQAEHAELGIVGTGETVLVAQFATSEQAKEAAAYYWRAFKLTNTSGDETRGWRARRALSSDYVEMLRTGRNLFVWTALTKEVCAARRAASSLATSSPDVKPPPREPLLPALQPLGAFLRQPAMKGLGLALMVALYTTWFFKGAAWAASSLAAANTTAVSAAELAARLESVNALDVPFRIERGERPGEFFATWRYADAKWVDHARAHGLRRTFRIRLTLDESAHVVRATDYSAGYDWSAGADGARIAWQASLGIVFFQTEQRRVFGLQLDERGRFKPEFSYSYRFNLQEMKSPLIEAVTRAGWNWRPVVWQGPTWLRWFTE
jgi:hypothetical protein